MISAPTAWLLIGIAIGLLTGAVALALILGWAISRMDAG